MKARVKANLMVNESFIYKIIAYSDLKKSDYVLEVGAGTGNLTRKLLSSGCKVYAIELDKGFCVRLKTEFGKEKNFDLTCGDALKVPFPKCNKTVSNLPYDISKKITEKILKQNYSLAVLVYQKEFVDKLAAKVGSENYRYITALTQSCAKVEVLDTIPPNAFSPQPKVSSAIVRLTPFEAAEDGYILFLRKLFNQRNKKIAKVLKLKGLGELGEKRCYQLSAKELKSIYFNQS